MRFRGIFLVVALTAPGSWAAAADEPATSQPQTTLVNPDAFNRHDTLNIEFFSEPGSPGFKPGTTDAFGKAGKNPSMMLRSPRDPGMPVDPQVLVNRNLCYTMRTYKVSPSERLPDNESGFKGYSSCQLASTYRFRSADTHGETGAKLK